MRMKYVIVAPKRVSTSAGIVGLHQLSADLNKMGEVSRVLVFDEGGTVTDDEIVVYPDCFAGNPLGAKNVVRYLMMYAGFFGQDTNFPVSELMFYYSRDFILNGRNAYNILTVPMLNESRFPWRPPSQRSGSCYLAIKYKNYFGLQPTDLPQGCIEIDNHMDLSDLFSRVKTLVTFDNSAINLEAALSGVAVEYRFNEKFEKPFDFGPDFDYADVRGSYERQKARYWIAQLPDFIEKTQRAFK